jgi:hypothetical protein
MDKTFDYFIRAVYDIAMGAPLEAYKKWLEELEAAE